MNLVEKMGQEIKERVADLLFPKECLGCGKEGKYICNDCEVFLGEAAPAQIDYSAKYGLDGLVSMWEYEGIAKEALHRIKYRSNFDAIPEFLRKAFQVMRRDVSRFELFLSFLFSEDVCIAYVPMHIKKQKRRGFNQSKIIAKELGKMIDKETVNLLEKIKDTPSQTNLDREERIKNVKDSFAIRLDSKLSLSFTPKGPYASTESPESSLINVLLVDDVWTTGATMKECCKTLKKAGVQKVWGFTLFRDV